MLKDEAAVQSMSRTGKKEELLEGPLIYGAVHLVGTLLCWLKSYAPLVTTASTTATRMTMRMTMALIATTTTTTTAVPFPTTDANH